MVKWTNVFMWCKRNKSWGEKNIVNRIGNVGRQPGNDWKWSQTLQNGCKMPCNGNKMVQNYKMGTESAKHYEIEAKCHKTGTGYWD